MTPAQQLLKNYEAAFTNLDFAKEAEYLADGFISAGPKGSIAQNKQQFLEMAGQVTEFYKKGGFTSVKLLEMYETPITDQYSSVQTHWGATFQKTGDQMTEFDITFIIQLTGSEPKILLFITHQDEEEMMKELGIMQ